jgi:hypothetical protein
MDSEDWSCEEKAEILRKKNRYRELILSGRLTLPHRSASQLLGPDCLYHLYSTAPGAPARLSQNSGLPAIKHAQRRRGLRKRI